MATKTFGDMFKKVVRQVGLTNSFTDDLEETENIKEDINQIQKQVLSMSKTYLQKSGISVAGGTVADQANYTIPSTVDKVSFVQITSGGNEYFPTQISIEEYNALVNTDSTSDIPVYWTIDKAELYIYPVPATSSLPITLNANQYATDLVTDPGASTDLATALEIKEGYENVIYFYALTEAYYRLEDFASGDRYDKKYTDIYKEYKKEVKNPTNSVVVGGRLNRYTNPNDNPTLT